MLRYTEYVLKNIRGFSKVLGRNMINYENIRKWPIGNATIFIHKYLVITFTKGLF